MAESKREPDEFGPIVGARIKKLREAKAISAKALGQRIGDEGVDSSQIYRWERGFGMPTSFNLAQIADALGCSADYLLDRTDDPTFVPVRASGALHAAAEAAAQAVEQARPGRTDLRKAAQRPAAEAARQRGTRSRAAKEPN